MKSYRNFVVNTNHEMSISLHLVYNYWRNCSTNTHIKGWVKWYHGICSLLFYIIHLESFTKFLFYKIKIVYLKIYTSLYPSLLFFDVKNMFSFCISAKFDRSGYNIRLDNISTYLLILFRYEIFLKLPCYTERWRKYKIYSKYL